MRSTILRRGAAGLVLVLAAGCGSTPQPPAAGTPATATPPATPPPTSTAATSTAAPTPAPSTTPAFVADTEDQVGEATGSSEQVSGVTVVAREGYDEVALDVGGEPGAVPGFRVGYVDAPVGDPTGDPVAVEGSAYLQVFVTGVSGAPVEGDVLLGPQPGSGAVVAQVVAGASFEGMQQLFVGLDSQRPFRVRASADPGRVVVQVLTG